jgi:hypothetical protein
MGHFPLYFLKFQCYKNKREVVWGQIALPPARDGRRSSHQLHLSFCRMGLVLAANQKRLDPSATIIHTKAFLQNQVLNFNTLAF